MREMSGKLAQLGWDPARADEVPELCLPARVSRVDRGGADLLAEEGDVRATFGADVLAAMAHDPLATPTVGDWVGYRVWPDDRVTIDAVLERASALRRSSADTSSREQILAANVDLVVIVEPLVPEPELGRIERLLVLAWSSGATPLVVLTKADLVHDAHTWVADVSAAAPGAEVVAVSSVRGEGLPAVSAQLCPGRTVVLLGASGAGKSTLTNALVGGVVMVTRELRADGKGRHTTTHRQLVPLPSGAVLIDTPGLRAVSLVGDEEALGLAFGEIEELGEQCRFRDCTHNSEPGCAVLAAVESGELDLRRLESWRKLQREVRWQNMRQDARLRAQERARWKSVSKSLRRDGRPRP